MARTVTKLDQWTPTRRSLLTRLKSWDDQESWRDFFDSYWRLIYAVARKAGLGESDAEDVVQETVASVARQMPNFKYDPGQGSFKSWLLLITRRRIADHLRKEYRRPAISTPPDTESGGTAVVERIADPAGDGFDAIWEAEWREALWLAAVKRAKRRVDPGHFQIFDCHFRKEWPAKEVARAFGVSENQVYLVKHRVSRLIEEELARMEKEGVA
jgi:RNA polymerase sigma-70 factor (ECF subfamily)